jgi:hypothetical protein
MKNEIVAKLSARMKRLPIAEEEGVVYVLTEVRKIFEHDHSQHGSFPTLSFYCNWALHTSLDRSAQDFLNDVMPILTINGNHTEARHKVFDGLLTLRAFRDELARFFASNGIADTLCTNGDYWSRFLDASSRVVEHSTLALKGNGAPSGPLNLAVESITIKAVPHLTFAENRPYPMEWLLRYKDGRTGTLSLSKYGLAGAAVILR